MDLKLDTMSNVIKIHPHVFAECNEEFLIYSPIKETYMYMSKSPSLRHHLHSKVEMHANRKSERNFFKLEKVEGKDSYYLLNIDTGKKVYVEGNNVRGVSGNPADHPHLGDFEFTFECYGQTGCFYIKNGGKYIYVSRNTSGIQLHHLVHAQERIHDDSHVFQFVLEKVGC